MLAARPARAAPAGDGHPVLVLPGLIAGDATTRPLRRYLGRLGYAAHGWRQGLDLGPRDGVIERCLRQLQSLRREQGRAVSLIGWSLGGIYARELAKLAPRGRAARHHPRHAVHRAPEGDAGVAPLRGARRPPDWRARDTRAAAPAATGPDHVDLQSQRRRRVVALQRRARRAAQRKHRGREASHLGIGFNPLTFYAIADRLAQPQGEWRPFERRGLRRCLYRDPYRPSGPNG